tara:strand:- start:415 stop:900 length:486 start_codon:yes stop_codon:yes gene_type:complete
MTDKPYATSFNHLTDLKDSIGKELGLTKWNVITQEKINTFAELTGDNQWIHIDEKKSNEFSPYGQTVAHGFLVLSFASKFTFETYRINDVSMCINYGLDKVRFPHPMLSGSKVRGRLFLMEFIDFEGGGRYKLKVIFECEGTEKPVCIAEFIAQAYIKKDD